jgi:hypothetical protein
MWLLLQLSCIHPQSSLGERKYETDSSGQNWRLKPDLTAPECTREHENESEMVNDLSSVTSLIQVEPNFKLLLQIAAIFRAVEIWSVITSRVPISFSPPYNNCFYKKKTSTSKLKKKDYDP